MNSASAEVSKLHSYIDIPNYFFLDCHLALTLHMFSGAQQQACAPKMATFRTPAKQHFKPNVNYLGGDCARTSKL